MYLGKILGHVEARVRTAGMEAQRLVLVQPLDFHKQPVRWTIVAADVVGASVGSLVAYEEGREAANPFNPPLPVDACVVAVVESYQFAGQEIKV